MILPMSNDARAYLLPSNPKQAFVQIIPSQVSTRLLTYRRLADYLAGVAIHLALSESSDAHLILGTTTDLHVERRCRTPSN